MTGFTNTLRVATICALTGLTMCAGGTGSADLSPATPAQPAAQQTAPAPPPAPPQRQVAATPEQIKADCWMKYENDKRIKNIDQRLQLVEKCVDETSRAQPAPRPER